LTRESFWKDKRVLVTGGAGFLGSHLTQLLTKREHVPENCVIVPRSRDIDLRRFEDARRIVKSVDLVIHLAARVGGIGFNQEYPGQLFYDNITMGVNLLEAARLASVEKFVEVGTVCAYPKFAKVPFKEDELWDGYPEETNAPYGIAKKAVLVMAQAYRQEYGLNTIYLLPVNLYGPGDNFDPKSSHVIPALIRKFVGAVERSEKEVVVWGSGRASREFLYVDDAADGIILATKGYSKPDPVNLGTGHEISITDLVSLIAKLTGFSGKVVWDTNKPDGQPRRCLDTSRAQIEFGFQAKTSLQEGLMRTIHWWRSRTEEAAREESAALEN